MEMTHAERADLLAIVNRHVGEVYARESRAAGDTGDAAKAARRQKREQLKALRRAWDNLDAELQQDVIGHVLRMWEEYDHESQLPDVGRIADDLAAAMKRAPHREETYPGFKEATLFLWRAFYSTWGGPAVFDEDARTAIGGELAELFGLPQKEAERRAKDDIDEARKKGLIGG